VSRRAAGDDVRRAQRADPETTGSIGRTAPAPRRTGRSFMCQPTADAPKAGTPANVRVRVEPDERVILVDASGAVQRYTLDTDWDVWFNGRSERDPRLGIILSPSRGSMWLDMPSRATARAEVRSLPFQCEPEGTVY
jgi:hypothetical protein